MPEKSEERDRPLEGIVLGVGRGKLLESGQLVPLECGEGDVVQFGKYAGIHVFDESIGHDVLLMREDEALGRKKKSETPLAFEHEDGGRFREPHVPGDPRCPVCRAGRVDAPGAELSSAR